MCQDQSARMIIKRGAGVPTIPVSADHRNGDWIATDIYEGEFYIDTNTGLVYTRNGSIITLANGKPRQLVWKALITQTGTNAPVLTVVENTLGVTITPSYVSVGVYQLSGFNSNLIINQVEIYGNMNHVGDQWDMELDATTDSILSIATFEVGTGYINGVLNGIGNSVTVVKY